MVIPEGSTLGAIAQNVGMSLEQVTVLAEAVAYVVGMITVMASLFMFNHQGQGNVPTRFPKAFLTLAVGILFIYLPELFGTGAQTFWGGEASQVQPGAWEK